MSSRPLPVDFATLKAAYMPPEPDTTVTGWRATIARIDEATAAVHAELLEADERTSAVVAQLVDLTHDGRDVSGVLKEFRPARAHSEQRLSLLARARDLAVARLARAERTDSDFLAWRAECQTLTLEWEMTGSGDTVEQRYARLALFAANH